MSRRSQRLKAITRGCQKIGKKFLSAIKKQIIWLLRTIFQTHRRRDTATAGFVLPTVVMVSVVVILLTAAILFRSFQRAQNASNIRVNEVVLQAATPAIDRARAKLNKLFLDKRLPRATPSDDALYTTLANNIEEYSFGDEKVLELSADGQTIRTAWRFPIDTDNNGKFDTFTLYGIYFKNPPLSNGQYTRARNALEARTPPMNYSSAGGDCGDTLGTSAILVGSNGWFKFGSKLKKAFFVYTANVPITSTPNNIPSGDANKYEINQGNKGFSALEYQQDRVQLPLVNNAVLYEDDIGLSPGPAFRLNGRIFTNSNFLTGSPGSGVRLYQVSSKASCFYDPDNAKIVVGGNLGTGGLTDSNPLGNVTKVDLYRGTTNNPTTIDFESSISLVANEANLIAYNSLAFVKRINRLVDYQMSQAVSTDPSEVTIGIAQEKLKLGLASYTAAEEASLRRQQLELYFKKRTRRVPFKEVPDGGDALTTNGTNYATSNPTLGSGDSLRPIDAWVFPFDPTDGKTESNYAKLALPISSGKLRPSATEPNKLQNDFDGQEQYLGDRAILGHGLPQLWWNGTAFVGPNIQDIQNISNVTWDNGPGNRYRRSRVETLADVGSTDRDKDWEKAAAQVPANPQDAVGGLRVITNAGIYLPPAYTTTGSATDSDFALAKAATLDVWSDMMPIPSTTAPVATATSVVDVSGVTLPNPTYTPYLRMRATAVYHYKSTGYTESNPTPIACISSYYDPTNSTTAKNRTGLPYNAATGGRSNNGVVYGPPNRTVSNYQNVLNYLADLKYPVSNRSIDDGLLKRALGKSAANRTLSEKSAIDSAICALQILDGSLTALPSPSIPHGTVEELAFLDARQIRTNQLTSASTTYDLPRQDRQPLEIRATKLDINLLRTTQISGSSPQEYLLPNSGIIYVTRDGALPDLSADPALPLDARKLESPVDFKLDASRRPGGVVLVNGSRIWRTTNYRDEEKGLILATNLPAYVKGNFNLHSEEEFTNRLEDSWSDFYERTKEERNRNFACRPGDSRLPNCASGDEWRPATILADSLTLLSNNFRFGFRDEGEYDKNNNSGSAVTGVNTYATDWANYPTDDSKKWFYNLPGDAKNFYPKDFDESTAFNPDTPSTYQGSSYLNNFVTPLQLVTRGRAIATEVCTAANPADCNNPDNWYIATGNNCSNGLDSQKTAGASDGILGQPINSVKTGTIGTKPDCSALATLPTRPAFKRNPNGSLFLQDGQPVVYGFAVEGGTAKLRLFPYSTWSSSKPNYLSEIFTNNGYPVPWFKTQDPTTGAETFNPDNPPLISGSTSGTGTSAATPSYKPVLQIDAPFAYSGDYSSNITPGNHRYWLQVATETTFNLVAAVGDTPARPTEDNGGLHNFVRFLENWNPTGTTNDAVKARISGSFIQLKRSAYATAPFASSLTTQGDEFRYKIQGNNNRTPFYLAPTRQWGYDVGLLSQSPDLFAQKLVTIPDDKPDEYFREVGRDDKWIQTLLCAKTTDPGTPYAIDRNQRPSPCQ